MAVLKSESPKAFQQSNELFEKGLLFQTQNRIGLTSYQEQFQINLLCNFHLFQKLSSPSIHRKALKTSILKGNGHVFLGRVYDTVRLTSTER